MAPRFSSSCSVVETPRRTELTPSLRRHQAENRGKNFNLKGSKGSFVSGIVCTAQICVFWLLPMANCAAVQLNLSASRWSSLILMSCLRPSSLFTRSFSHWYPFKWRKWRKWRKTLLRLSDRRRTITPKPI